jgi:hypothetical protein
MGTTKAMASQTFGRSESEGSVDTGAQVYIIDEKTFSELKLKPKLYKCTMNLYPYNSNKTIETMGQFETRVLLNGMYHEVRFVVVKGSAGNLISYQTSVEIGIVNEIKQVNTKDSKLEEWKKQKFPRVFAKHVGKFKSEQVKLHIDNTIHPVKAKPRTITIHLREKVENEIKRMLDNDLIEPVNGCPQS